MYRFYFGNLVSLNKYHKIANKHIPGTGTGFEHRIKLAESQNWRCAYCGFIMDEHSSTLDHVIPKCRSYIKKEWQPNHVAACYFCNNIKGKRLGNEFYKLVQQKGILNIIKEEYPSAYNKYKKFMINAGYPIINSDEKQLI